MSDALVKALHREGAELDRLRAMKANAEKRAADLGPRIAEQEKLVRHLNGDPRIPAESRLDLDGETEDTPLPAAPDPDGDPDGDNTPDDWSYPQPEGQPAADPELTPAKARRGSRFSG